MVPLTQTTRGQFGVNIGAYACGVAPNPAPLPTNSRSEMSVTQPVPAKPKQSKSRNGCVTCKAKRLKCDETKPTCLQCCKRGVVCGGFKKDFKWRPFEEANIVGKGSRHTRKGSNAQKTRKSPSPQRNRTTDQQHAEEDPAPMEDHVAITISEYFDFDDDVLLPDHIPELALNLNTASTGLSQYPVDGQHPDLLSPMNMELTRRATSPIPKLGPPCQNTAANFMFPDYCFPPENALAFKRTAEQSMPATGEEGLDEVVISSASTDINWLYPSRGPFVANDGSSRSFQYRFFNLEDMFCRPALDLGSSELLVSHFDRHTCGIMSVKDGPTENPWRTLIWPMAKESPALRHAVFAMTAFHMSRSRPALRLEGVEHMRQSISYLAQGLSENSIRQDAALATTLVLAFSEAFDRHIVTGIQHLRGARGLLSQINEKGGQQLAANPGLVQRYQFLYNVWVYLDVLARLTSTDNADESSAQLYKPVTSDSGVDPLLGCAAELFPLLARAADIGQLVRRNPVNSLEMISSALQLQRELQTWTVPAYIQPPEDESSALQHCINTAEAYRYAILLYLHHTVPEVPSTGAEALAAMTLRLIAAIPISSRAVIVHIFPLLVAGCEAVGQQRVWVKNRWEQMMNRMWIGNVEKAKTVTEEVWRRRDGILDLERRGVGSVFVPGTGLRVEFGARGRAHWLGVMKDWGWEVLLG